METVFISSPLPVIPRRVGLEQQPASVSRDGAIIAMAGCPVKFVFSSEPTMYGGNPFSSDW
jgi:hypothetical protein